jgi:hypothetical protein
MNPFAFASPSKGDRVSASLFVPEKRSAATREKPRTMPGPEAVAFRSDGEDAPTKKKKKVRFAPEAPEVFAAKRNGATTKQTSGSVQPPSRKRRKPLLDISRNARGDATSCEGGNGAKRNARPAKKTAVPR